MRPLEKSSSDVDSQKRRRASEFKPSRRASLLRKASSNMLQGGSGLEHSELGEADLQKAAQHMKEHMPAGGDKRIFPISHLDEFGEWGIGVQLYFQFTYMFMKVSGFMALLFMPQLLCNLKGNSMERLHDGTSFLQVLSDGMIPNFGSLNSSNTSTITEVSGKRVRLTRLTTSRNFEMFGSGTTAEDMTFYFAICDAVASIIFFSFCVWFEYIHIPSVVLAHRTENVSAETYTLFVDRLPRRIARDSDMESYAARLKDHFELLLAAQVTEKSARKGTTVIAVDDKGSKVENKAWLGLSFCPRRLADGYDARGRRLGRIVKLGKSGKEAWVEWKIGTASNDQPPQANGERGEKYLLSDGREHGDLLDAILLWRIEGAGLNIYEPAEDPGNKKECCVYAVDLVRDFQGRLGDMKHKAKNDDRTHEEKMRELQRQKEAFNNRRQSALSVRGTMFRLGSERSFTDLDTALQEFKLEERQVVGAFVTFNHIKHRDFLFDEYRFSRVLPLRVLGMSSRLLFHETPIRVTEAQAPCDIYWDNLDCPSQSRWKRLLVVYLCGVAILAGVTVLVLLARDSAQQATQRATGNADVKAQQDFARCQEKGFWSVWNDDPPGLKDECGKWFNARVAAGLWKVLEISVAVSVIFVSGFFVEALAQFAKPFTISSEKKIVMVMAFVLYLLILGPIRTFLNADLGIDSLGAFGNGEYKDLGPKWYLHVGTSIATTLVINTGYPSVALSGVAFFSLLIHTLKKRQKLMTDLLDLYTPPEFPFALRHAEQLSQFFAAYWYCPGMPIIAFLIPLSCFVYYTVDKYVFLRGSRIPPRYTETLMTLHVKALRFAVLFHVFFAVEVYSNQESAPSDCVAQCNLDFGAGTESATDVQVSKYLKKSTVPLTLLALAILCFHGARLTQFILGGNAYWLGGHGTGHADEVHSLNEEESFYNEVAAMKRRGFDINFQVEDMEHYRFLQDPSKRDQESPDSPKLSPGGVGQADRATRSTASSKAGSEAGSEEPKARARSVVVKTGKQSLAARHQKSEEVRKEKARKPPAPPELGSTARLFEHKMTEKSANEELPVVPGKAAAARLTQPGKLIAKTKSPRARDHLDYHHDDDLHQARQRLVYHQSPASPASPADTLSPRLAVPAPSLSASSASSVSMHSGSPRLAVPAPLGKKLTSSGSSLGSSASSVLMHPGTKPLATSGFQRASPVVLAPHLDLASGSASPGKNLHDPNGLTLGLNSGSPSKGSGKGKAQRKRVSRGSRPNSRGPSAVSAPALLQTTIGNVVHDNWG